MRLRKRSNNRCPISAWCLRVILVGELANLQDQQLPLSELFEGLDRAAVEQLLEHDDEVVMDRLEELLLLKKPAPDANIALVNTIIAAIEADDTLSTVSAVANSFRYSERWMQQSVSHLCRHRT